jgi:DNA-binding response OmpR family regulator
MAAILIVEDDYLWVTMIQDILLDAVKDNPRHNNTFTFDSANEAGKALLMIQTNHYDLVITDYYMAKMDGFELVHEIRKIKSSAELPVIVLTGVDGIDIKYEALRHGATDGFAKPLRGEELQRFKNVVFNLISER